MPLHQYALAPDPSVACASYEPVPVPPECTHLFGIMCIEESEPEAEVIVLHIPRCRDITVQHLVELVRRMHDSRQSPDADAVLLRYVDEVVLRGRGIAEDVELVELLSAADFTACAEAVHFLSHRLMCLVRSADTCELLGRPLTLKDKLDILGEMTLVHHLAGR